MSTAGNMGPHVDLWNGAACTGKHKWGGEMLHTFTATAHMVTVRICTMCGAVRRERRLVMRPARGGSPS